MISFLTCLLVAVSISMGDTNTSVLKDSSNNSVVESDTLFVKFENDTIAMQESRPVSQIIYAEHKE